MQIKSSISKNKYNNLLNSLYQLRNDLYSVETSIEDKINKFLSEDEYALFQEYVSSNNLPINSIENLRIAIDEYEKDLRNMPKVIIRIAFEPKVEEINKIVSFFNSRLDYGLIVDIKVDKSVIGGAIIEFNGKYYDYSIKNVINRAFSADSNGQKLPVSEKPKYNDIKTKIENGFELKAKTTDLLNENQSGLSIVVHNSNNENQNTQNGNLVNE